METKVSGAASSSFKLPLQNLNDIETMERLLLDIGEHVSNLVRLFYWCINLFMIAVFIVIYVRYLILPLILRVDSSARTESLLE